MLYRYQSNQILTYTFTYEQGLHTLKNVPVGIFTLKVTMLGYHPFTKELIIAASDSVQLPFSFSMHERVTELPTLVVEATQLSRSYTLNSTRDYYKLELK